MNSCKYLFKKDICTKEEEEIRKKEIICFPICSFPKCKEYEESDSRYISSSKRYEVLHRQKWRCNQCGKRLRFSDSSPWSGLVAHIDHIHPYSKRDTFKGDDINSSSNLQALCPECNLKKSDKKRQ